MNNTGEEEDRETGEEMTQNKAAAAEGQTPEVSPIQGENGDNEAPQPEEEEAKGEEPAETGPPQPEEDQGTGENLEEEAAEETQTEDPQPEVTGGCGSWLKYPRKLLLWMKGLATLANGLCAVKFLSYAITFISAFYCRTLGSAKIESLCLGIAMFNIAGESVAIGLAQTFNTLISQTYGCGNMKRIGVIMQRAVLFACLLWFFSWSALIYTEPIALFLNRTPQVASDAQLYAYIMIPAVPACFLYQLQAKFLQNQNIVFPQLGTGICVTILNWIMIDGLVRKLQLGLIGSAVATAISHILLALILFIIIIAKGLHKATWPGRTQDCLQEWGSFSVTAFFSVMMLCAELWVFEAWVFILGAVDKVELAAQRLIHNAYSGAIAIPMGVAETASVNVGSALGAKKKGTATSFWLTVVCSAGIGVPVGLLLHMFGQVFVLAYFIDGEVTVRLGEGFAFVPVFIFDAFVRVMGGGIRGAGKVWMAAVCTIAGHIMGFYISLCLTDSEGIKGYGTGILAGVFVQSLCYFCIMNGLDWHLAAEKAQVRAGILMGDGIGMIPRGPGASAAAPNKQLVPFRRVTVLGDVLPWKQLVKRRVLALCFAVMVLFAASVARVFVMKMLLDKGNAAASPPPSAIPASAFGE